MKNWACGIFSYLALAAVKVYACPLCAEGLRRVNNGKLIQGYFFAYGILVLVPVGIVGTIAWILLRAHSRKMLAHPPR